LYVSTKKLHKTCKFWKTEEVQEKEKFVSLSPVMVLEIAGMFMGEML